MGNGQARKEELRREAQQENAKRQVAEALKTQEQERRQEAEARIKQEQNKRAEAEARMKEKQKAEDKEREDRQKRMQEFQWGPKRHGSETEEEAADRKEENQVRKIFTASREDFQKECEDHLRILLFGTTGCGKSSFANGCRTAVEDMDQPSTYHCVRGLDTSVTKRFSLCPFGEINLIDMPGIFESDEIKDEDIENIATGNLSFCNKVSEHLNIIDREDDHLGEKVDCVVIVSKFDADLTPNIKRLLNKVMSLAGEGRVSCHLVLTHLDVCDPTYKQSKNLKKIYNSEKVQSAVKRMSELTGLPPLVISFVKNYTTETEADNYMKLQHLDAFKSIVHTAKEHAIARTIKEKAFTNYKENVRKFKEEREAKEEKEAEENERKRREAASYLNFHLEKKFTRTDIYFVLIAVFLAVVTSVSFVT